MDILQEIHKKSKFYGEGHNVIENGIFGYEFRFPTGIIKSWKYFVKNGKFAVLYWDGKAENITGKKLLGKLA